MSKPFKHTIKTAQDAIHSKGFDYIRVISVDTDNDVLTIKDTAFGIYQTSLKALGPKSSFPLHAERKRLHREKELKAKLINKTIKDHLILDVFYGPNQGYKNKSFMVEYRNVCGHTGVATYSILLRHKKTESCKMCSKADHGVRAKVDGVLPKRTMTYNYWVSHKKELPDVFKEFRDFKIAVGERPSRRATLEKQDGRYFWKDASLHPDKELNLIASAIRQAFRHSTLYKAAIINARIETEDGPRFVCAECKGLARRKDIQVDHITPVAPVDGSPLDKNTLIDRIWTDQIQVLDRKCHNRKSQAENQARRKNKLTKP